MAGNYPRPRTQRHTHPPTRFTINEYLVLKWADDNARARPSQWVGGQPKSPLPPSAKLSLSSARHHYPRPIYDGRAYFEILF